MNNGVYYRGIGNYNRRNEIKYYKVIQVIFLISLLFSMLIGSRIFYSKFIQHESLSEKSIENYQSLVNDISNNRAYINWQEVAAINEVINDGKKDKVLEQIAGSFLKEEQNNKFTILTLDEVISKLNINLEQKNKIREYLSTISESTSYKEVVIDKEKISFIESIKEAAMESYEKYGILPSITIAQAILESAWGTSELATQHNNIFGIKADNRWSGEVATITTKENYNDVIQANFRKYDSIIASVDDHGEFLAKNKRYSDSGMFSARDYIQQAQALENAGYSTSKNEAGEKIYADKLISVVQKYNLMVFDKEAMKKRVNN